MVSKISGLERCKAAGGKRVYAKRKAYSYKNKAGTTVKVKRARVFSRCLEPGTTREYTVKQLRKVAKRHRKGNPGLAGYSSLKKKQLLGVLHDYLKQSRRAATVKRTASKSRSKSRSSSRSRTV